MDSQLPNVISPRFHFPPPSEGHAIIHPQHKYLLYKLMNEIHWLNYIMVILFSVLINLSASQK